MLSFIGDYSCKADSKFRVMVPASFRKALLSAQQTVFILRKNVYKPCIDMYPYSAWETLVSGLRAQLKPFDEHHDSFRRELYRGTLEVEMDGNGRILLPKRLLEIVGVEKDLVLAGQDTKIELWASEAYEAAAMTGEEFAALTQEVFKTTENGGR